MFTCHSYLCCWTFEGKTWLPLLLHELVTSVVEQCKEHLKPFLDKEGIKEEEQPTFVNITPPLEDIAQHQEAPLEVHTHNKGEIMPQRRRCYLA